MKIVWERVLRGERVEKVVLVLVSLVFLFRPRSQPPFTIELCNRDFRMH